MRKIICIYNVLHTLQSKTLKKKCFWKLKKKNLKINVYNNVTYTIQTQTDKTNFDNIWYTVIFRISVHFSLFLFFGCTKLKIWGIKYPQNTKLMWKKKNIAVLILTDISVLDTPSKKSLFYKMSLLFVSIEFSERLNQFCSKLLIIGFSVSNKLSITQN